jgi:hypothetical protein
MRNLDTTRLARLMTPHASKHAFSRRAVLKAGAATTAVVAVSAALAPMRAAAAGPGPGTPVPVAGDPAFGGLHIFGVGIGTEPSAITDFNGAVGAAIVDGTGVGTNASGATEALLFDTDMRFMQGVFRGTDGRVHQGTFAFV